MLNVTTIMYCRHVASEGTVGYQLHASNTVYDIYLGDRDGMTRLSLMKRDL